MMIVIPSEAPKGAQTKEASASSFGTTMMDG